LNENNKNNKPTFALLSNTKTLVSNCPSFYLAEMNFVSVSLSIAILSFTQHQASSSFIPSHPSQLIQSIVKESLLDSPKSHHNYCFTIKKSVIRRKRFSSSTTIEIAKDTQRDMGNECSYTIRENFKGKNVILTGASGGLGKAMAIQFAKCHVKTLILSGRDSDALKGVQTACEEILQNEEAKEKISSNVHVIKCDLSNSESVSDLATESLRLCENDVHVLVNNGGTSSRSSFLETKIEVDELVMKINFVSGAALAKKIVPGMVENGNGQIIWISSVQGLLGTPFRTSYAASKFAVQGYCEALRSELTSSGVSVHVVSPGYISTNLSKSAICGDGSKYGITDETTAKGADPNDVAIQILHSVSRGKSDLIVAATFSAKVALWIKFFAPSFLQKLLVKRFEKASIQQNKLKSS